MKLKDKVVFITGGARGIGEAFADALVAEGATVMIADISAEHGAQTSKRIRDSGGRCSWAQCDVANDDSVTAAVQKTIAEFGGIDILINNAGKHLTEFGQPVTTLSSEKWREMLDVNVIGLVSCARACKQTLAARGGGVIVNLASISGFLSNTAYGISKLAVRGLTVALAIELAGQGTRVFGIAPGIMDSAAAMSDLRDRLEPLLNRQLIKRVGRIQELIPALLFLCSDDSSYMTGETLMIAGGFPTRL
jgi:NAD(P)-dependent dehydrogenase (short-subunit alcohol dehydrogenase family)